MGKYVSVNELSTFVFHDATLAGLAFEGRDMVWHVESLGVCSENSQNNHSAGRMIKKAKVLLHDYALMSDPNTEAIFTNTLAEIIRFAHDGATDFSCFFEAPSDEQETLCGDVEWIHSQFARDNEIGLLSFSVKFSKLTIEWDEFGGPGWWEKRP